MNDSELRSVSPADMVRDEALGSALLALNNAHAQELSWLEPERLEYLIGEAFLARRIGELDAFLLMANARFVVTQEPTQLDLARRSLERRLSDAAPR